jgi:hypothetical protein
MSYFLCTLLLAEVHPRGPKPGDWAFGWDRVGMVAGGALVVIVIAWIMLKLANRRERRITHSPWCLFKELCSAHGLAPRERQLLKRLAQQHSLENPAMVLIDENLWDGQRLGPAWSRCLPELDALRKRLFAARREA